MAYVYPFRDAGHGCQRVVWYKGKKIPDHDADVWRQDIFDNVMKFDQHGQETEHGWEIDHVHPLVLGGLGEITNLQPLQWQNNRRKGDSYPWSCDD